MKHLRSEAVTAYVERETEAVSGVAHAMQAATSIVDAKSTNSMVVDGQRMAKVSAVVLKELVGFENVDIGTLDGGSLRQLCQGYRDDQGILIGGRFITVDVVAVVLFDGSLISARQWLNNLLSQGKIISSLAYVASGHPSVSLLELINM